MVSPAPAGMIPIGIYAYGYISSEPRTRGDDPKVKLLILLAYR